MLKRIFLNLFFLFVCSNDAWSDDFQYTWKIHCLPEKHCQEIEQELLGRPIEVLNHQMMIQHIKSLLYQPSISSLVYKTYFQGNEYQYFLEIRLKPIISKIAIEGLDSKISNFVLASLQVSEGDFLDRQKLNDGLFRLNATLVEKGLLEPHSSWNYDPDSGVLKIRYSYLQNIKLTKIVFAGDQNSIGPQIESKFERFFEKKLDIELIKEEIQKAGEDLKGQGYINSVFELEKPELNKIKNGEVELKLTYKIGKKILFQFYDNKILSRQELLGKIRGLFNKYQLDLSISGLETEIIKAYEEKGIFNTTVETLVRDEFQGDGWIYYFHIREGKKLKISNRVYLGNKAISREEIDTIFSQLGTDLTKAGFYDRNYYENSGKKIENEYFKKGFVLASVEGPTLQSDLTNTEAIAVFKIKEGAQAIVRNLKISGLQVPLDPELSSLLYTQENKPFSPSDFEQDLEKIKKYFKDRGYLFAKFNSKEDSFVSYDKKFEAVEIRIDFEKGPLVKAKNILIVGTLKTRHKAIYRETMFTRGDIITQEKISKTEDKLNALGIFSSLEVKPIGLPDSEGNIDVLISVKERNFGSMELSPGYRTDLGAKVGAEIGYNNLFGMNRAARFKTEVNQRLDNEGLDETKRSDGSTRRDGDKFLEYSAELGFAEPYIFNLPLAFNTSVAHSLHRYLSVDAYNTKVNAGLSKEWTDFFSTVLGYQLENIRQFNATKLQDEGDYRIGSISPGVALDFRNSKIYATQGALFRVSFEYAGPTLLSQENTYPKIHFYKVVSRNNFYFPLFDDVVLATSFSGGLQQNLERDYLRDYAGNIQTTENGVIKREGHIPSIKVFRLGGINPVRGYSDTEVNRLIGENQSISDVLVQDRAYFLNLNLEPRMQMGDDLILGTFFDAGRVYLDSVRPEKMRKSVGLSLKYLTAVGTIDFHYGFKLDRREDLGEQIGRFHFSIGQF